MLFCLVYIFLGKFFQVKSAQVDPGDVYPGMIARIAFILRHFFQVNETGGPGLIALYMFALRKFFQVNKMGPGNVYPGNFSK